MYEKAPCNFTEPHKNKANESRYRDNWGWLWGPRASTPQTENVHRGSGQPPSHHTSWQSQSRSGIHSDTAEIPRTSKEPSLADQSTKNRQKMLVFKKTLNWTCTRSNKNNIFPVPQVRRSTNSNPERNWEDAQPLGYLGESLLLDWTFLTRNFGKFDLTLIPRSSLAYWLRTHNPEAKCRGHHTGSNPCWLCDPGQTLNNLLCISFFTFKLGIKIVFASVLLLVVFSFCIFFFWGLNELIHHCKLFWHISMTYS